MLNVNSTLLGGGNYKGGFEWNKKSTSIDQCFKIYQIVDGEGLVLAKDGQHILSAGKCYFINGYRIESQRCPGFFEVNWFHFISNSVFIKQVLKKMPVCIELDKEGLGQFEEVFGLLGNFFNHIVPNKEEHYRDYFMAYMKIQALISFVIGNFAKEMDRDFFKLEDVEARLMPAIEYINENFKRNISLKVLASECYLSENYFHSLFKKIFSVTPNNYILQLRMNEAVRLLSNMKLPIKEIALELGYCDSAYFTRTFTRYFGTSPKKYRMMKDVRLP